MKNSVNISAKRNLRMNLSKKNKRNIFRNSNEKKLSNNRIVLTEIKPYFSVRGGMSNRITFVEKDKLCAKTKPLLKL